MIYAHLFEQTGEKQIRAGLIGTGAYGTSLLAQTQWIPRLEIPVICEQDLTAAQQACQYAGIPEDQIALCDNRQAVLRAVETGRWAIIEDPLLLMDVPLDLIVECTGDPEAGALHAALAIQHGKHVAMVNKETDSVIGPILHHLAKQAGVVYTPVDGDQHGLLIGLVLWLRSLGLEVISAGKAHDGEYVYDDTTRRVSDRSTTVCLTEQESHVFRELREGETAHGIQKRREMLKALSHQ
jgi:predicted homoserine dehydrogenase-like protein